MSVSMGSGRLAAAPRALRELQGVSTFSAWCWRDPQVLGIPVLVLGSALNWTGGVSGTCRVEASTSTAGIQRGTSQGRRASSPAKENVETGAEGVPVLPGDRLAERPDPGPFVERAQRVGNRRIQVAEQPGGGRTAALRQATVGRGGAGGAGEAQDRRDREAGAAQPDPAPDRPLPVAEPRVRSVDHAVRVSATGGASEDSSSTSPSSTLRTAALR